MASISELVLGRWPWWVPLVMLAAIAVIGASMWVLSWGDPE